MGRGERVGWGGTLSPGEPAACGLHSSPACSGADSLQTCAGETGPNCTQPAHNLYPPPPSPCRLVEPYNGRIMMDGVNILDLGLDDVRGRIAAIPQVRMVVCACEHAGVAVAPLAVWHKPWQACWRAHAPTQHQRSRRASP